MSIGFHLAKLVFDEGYIMHDRDGLTGYYDVSPTNKRHGMLAEFDQSSFTVGMLEDEELIQHIFEDFCADLVIYIAAEAGVRYPTA